MMMVMMVMLAGGGKVRCNNSEAVSDWAVLVNHVHFRCD